jgi:hypothetical protein
MSAEELYRKLYPTERALVDVLLRGGISSSEANYLKLANLRQEVKDYLLHVTSISY